MSLEVVVERGARLHVSEHDDSKKLPLLFKKRDFSEKCLI